MATDENLATLADPPDAVQQWLLTTLRDKLVKASAKIIRHGLYVIFRMADVTIPRDMFADIRRRIGCRRPEPAAAQ